MIARVESWLQLLPGESRKVLPFALLGLLLQAGVAIGLSAGDSLFLAHVGAEELPRLYLLTPLMMLAYIPAYAWLEHRLGLRRVFQLTLLFIIAGGAGLAGMLDGAAAPAAWLCYAAKLYATLWNIALYSLLWTYLDAHFDLIDAKRFFALFSAGCALGAVLGGALVSVLAPRLGVANLFLVWAGAAALAWPLLGFIRRRHPMLETAAAARPATTGVVRRVVRAFTGNRYVLLLTAVLFATLAVATLCEFRYLGILSAGRDEQALAALFGRLYAGVNLLNLALTFFVFNRLVTRLGVRNVALIQPILYAAVFAALLFQGGLPAAVLGFVAYQGFMTAIDYNNVNLLFTGLPSGERGALRTSIEGLCEPLATAAAGGFLLWAAPRISADELSLLGFAGALACLGLVCLLRHDYPRALLANLKRDRLDFARSAPPRLDHDDLATLRAAASGPDAGEAVFAARLLWQSHPAEGVAGLISCLDHADAERQRLARPLLAEILATRDPDHTRRLLAWLRDAASAATPAVLEEFGRHHLLAADDTAAGVESREPDRRASAAVMLWQSDRLPDTARSVQALDALLTGGDREARLAGLHALGVIGEPRYAALAVPFLDSADPAPRRAALQALARLAQPGLRRLSPALIEAARAGPATERRLALDALAQTAGAAQVPALLAATREFSPRELRRAEAVIVALGRRAVPALARLLREARAIAPAHTLAARALGRLAPPQLEALLPELLRQSIQAAREDLATARQLDGLPSPRPGRRVLAALVRGQRDRRVRFILELLSASGRLAATEAVAAGLRATGTKERGFAVESLEHACPPALFAQLQPLIDGRDEAGLADPAPAAATLEARLAVHLREGGPLIAAAALQTLAELSPAALPALAADPKLPDAATVKTTLVILLARAAGETTPDTPPEQAAALLDRQLAGLVRPTHWDFLVPRLQAAGAANPPATAGRWLRAPDAPDAATWFLPDHALHAAAHVFPDLAANLVRRAFAPPP